jgi:hypothetical protein
MHDRIESVATPIRRYQKPEVIDRGTVETRTQDDTAGNQPEGWSNNIIWGNDPADPTPEDN